MSWKNYSKSLISSWFILMQIHKVIPLVMSYTISSLEIKERKGGTPPYSNTVEPQKALCE